MTTLEMLQHARRALLADLEATDKLIAESLQGTAAPIPDAHEKPRRGRRARKAAAPAEKGKRVLSPEARERIRAAQAKRWAEHRAKKAGKPAAA